MSTPMVPSSQPQRIVLYTTADGNVTVDVFFQGDNFWLPQRAMAELFGVKTPAISKHLKNIYESGELMPQATVSKMETVQSEGERHITRELLKSDVTIAKNYLNEREIFKLDRLVVMFIDFAEMRALNKQVMTMRDWLQNVEKFLQYTDQQVLRHAGKISHEMAMIKAHAEYEQYRVKQDLDYSSDFDIALSKYLKGEETP